MTGPAAARRLIVCADDFALHAGVSQAIVELAAQDRLSATSALVLGPGWAQDAPRLRELRGRLDVGLHLDWTSAFARARGHGRPLAWLMAQAASGRLRPAQARPVIEAQFDAFEAHWKAPPDHVDGHQHVQQFAGIREALVQVLRSRYDGRPYLRVSRAPPGVGGLKPWLIASMGANALEKIADDAGLARVTPVFGIYDFKGDAAAFARRMDRWLAAATDGALLMCHPARPVPEADAILAARQREWSFLASTAWPLALARAGVGLHRGALALA